MYSILFKSAWATLIQFGDNPDQLGAKLGMIAILHTWGQNLSVHPHLHCIVPAGGVSTSGHWKSTKSKGKFLFSVKAMSKVYRAKFVCEMRKSLPHIPQSLYDRLFEKSWVVYSKPSFGHPKHVVEYLGRYTHKIAITNHRILSIDKQKHTVTFSMKNYTKGGKKTTMTLTTNEFIRRFSVHILPKGFVRIRHYGILSGTWKKKHLGELQEQLNNKKVIVVVNDVKTHLNRCPYCKIGTLVIMIYFDNRGPPECYRSLLNSIVIL
jgi:hypothetical protein